LPGLRPGEKHVVFPSALIHWCIYRWISWIWFPIDLQNTLKFCQRLHDPALPNNMEKRRKTRTQRDTSEQSITFFSGMRRCHPTLKPKLQYFHNNACNTLNPELQTPNPETRNPKPETRVSKLKPYRPKTLSPVP